MVRGLVLDIQRFSLHDGPGIRTTVFLKGCPLRCLWCHNPESQLFKTELSYNSEKCVFCGACERVCPKGVHLVGAGGHRIDYAECAACGACVRACSFEALKLYGEAMAAEDIVNEAAKDIKYYENSGGGITVSGGEPLAQPEFTLEILKSARDRGTHTCIETSGYAPKSILDRILPYVDLLLFDYKATGTEKHRELTGVSNGPILENLEYCYDRGASIILRCPMIPGVNDSDDHLAAISEISLKHPRLKGIEILPYHDFGRGKWKELGREYTLSSLKNATAEQKAGWLSALASMGCKNARLA